MMYNSISARLTREGEQGNLNGGVEICGKIQIYFLDYFLKIIEKIPGIYLGLEIS